MSHSSRTLATAAGSPQALAGFCSGMYHPESASGRSVPVAHRAMSSTAVLSSRRSPALSSRAAPRVSTGRTIATGSFGGISHWWWLAVIAHSASRNSFISVCDLNRMIDRTGIFLYSSRGIPPKKPLPATAPNPVHREFGRTFCRKGRRALYGLAARPL
jgi:hypothetical protein